MKLRLLLFASLFILLQSCLDDNKSNTTDANTIIVNRIDKLSWLSGSWQINTPEVTITETWAKTDENNLSGNSYVISMKGDTVFTESLRITAIDDTLYYLPTISNQNEGKEIRFKEKSISDTEVVFENLAHDFPQRIVYQKTSDTTVYAYIEGMQDGKLRKEEFPYHKN